MRLLSTLVIRISADVDQSGIHIHPQYMPKLAPVLSYAEEARVEGVCSNSKKHGKAVVGGRCQVCWDKKRSAELAKRPVARAAAA